jgi:hypothetical protein
LKVDGNALSATSMNQTTIMNSRACLYSHPDDGDVITSMHLPGPREWEIDPTATAGFIKEEGLYGNLDDHDRDELPTPILSEDDTESFSLDDLEWPIPGRVHTWEGSQASG